MYVYTGELLGQPSPKSADPDLPAWARLYLKSVRARSLKSLTPYVSLFETITFHPQPLMSNSPLLKVLLRFEDESLEPFVIHSMFLSELRRIRDARLFQNKAFRQLHENHMKLFRDVVTRFNRFEPKDLEPILIESLLLPRETGFWFRGMPLWKLGKRFVQEKLPQELSTRVTMSAWYMRDALYTQLGSDLQAMAVKQRSENANFKKKVEIELKARAKRP